MGILHNSVATVFTLLGGVALVGAATALIVTDAPDGLRDLHAYEAAPHCPATPTMPAECRWTQDFTVSDIHLTYKEGEQSALLTSPTGTRWKTVYNARGPVLDHLDEGDHVAATIWRGHLTEITAKGAVQTTDKVPVDERERSLGVALILVPGGLLMTVACAWRLIRRRTEPTAGMEMTLALSVGLMFVAFCCAVVASILVSVLWPATGEGEGEGFWLMAAIFLPAAAILAAAARRSVKRSSHPRLRGASPRSQS